MPARPLGRPVDGVAAPPASGEVQRAVRRVEPGARLSTMCLMESRETLRALLKRFTQACGALVPPEQPVGAADALTALRMSARVRRSATMLGGSSSPCMPAFVGDGRLSDLVQLMLIGSWSELELILNEVGPCAQAPKPPRLPAPQPKRRGLRMTGR